MSAKPGSAGAPVGVAVVGLGYWGLNLLRNLQEIPDADVVRVCDTREERLALVSSRYPGVARSTSAEEVLADEAVQAVVIATPISTHYELGLMALEAGRHVLIEKPLAGSAQQASDLMAAALRAGLVLMPGHTFLYSPPVQTSADIISRGELGEIFFVTTSRVNLGLHQADVSVVWDLAPHDFSILCHWLGEVPDSVSAVGRGCIVPDTLDVAFINLHFPSGAVAHVELSWLAPSKLRRTAVVGSEKMLVYDDTSNEPVRVFDSGANLPDPSTYGEYRLTYRTGDIVSPRVEVQEPLALELADFCRAITTGAPARSTAELGLQVVTMIEAVDRSLAQGGQPVAVQAQPSAAPG